MNTISRNALKLPKHLTSALKKSPQIKLSAATVTKLRDACKLRSDACRQLFSQEITNVPECMTKDGHPYHGTKSDLLELFAPKEDHNNLHHPQKLDG